MEQIEQTLEGAFAKRNQWKWPPRGPQIRNGLSLIVFNALFPQSRVLSRRHSNITDCEIETKFSNQRHCTKTALGTRPHHFTDIEVDTISIECVTPSLFVQNSSRMK